jgi:hypothetical protein
LLVAFLGVLQVTVIFTAGEEKKRGRNRSRSPLFLEFLAAAREPTVPAVAEGLPCNFWIFRDCFFCKFFRLCYCNIIVIFV